MSVSKAALVAGCGYVGRELAHQLTNKSWSVDAIRRSKPVGSDEGFQTICQDLNQPFQLYSAYNSVFYLVSADSYRSESYESAYHTGLKNLLAALSKWPKPEQLIFVSSTSVYAQSDGAWVDEQSPVSQEGFGRQSLLAGEALALQSGIPSLVVRFSGIYGPERMRFRDSILAGTTALLERSCFTNRIHRGDCVGSLIHLMNNGKSNEVYIASDSEPADYNDVVRWICKQAGVKNPDVEASPSPSFHRGNKRCSNRKLLSTGYRFLYPDFRSGYATN